MTARVGAGDDLLPLGVEDLEVLDELVVVDRAGPAIKCNNLGGFPALHK